MSLLTALNEGKGVITAVAGIMVVAWQLDERHAPRKDFDDYVASDSVGTIFDLAKQAKDSGSPDWLCRLLEQEIISLCTRKPDHYICKDGEAKREIKASAGC